MKKIYIALILIIITFAIFVLAGDDFEIEYEVYCENISYWTTIEVPYYYNVYYESNDTNVTSIGYYDVPEERYYTVCKTKLNVKINESEYEYEFEDDHVYCALTENRLGVICDDDKTGDGNGDGVCDPGETCTYYVVGSSDLIFDSKWNGELRLR